MSETKLPDIVERLRSQAGYHIDNQKMVSGKLFDEAAAEIARLRSERPSPAERETVSEALCRNQLNGTAIVCAGVCEGCTVPSQPHPCEHAVTVWGSDADEVLRALLQGEAAPPPNKEK